MLPTRTVLLALFGAVVLSGCTNEPSGPPVIGSFTCTPTNLTTGAGPVTLTWRIAGALSASIAPGVGAVNASNGSTTVQVSAATTFTLTATGLSGTTTAMCSVSVEQKPVINSFIATPDNLPYGGGFVVLSWNVTGAASLSIDQGVGPVTPVTVGSKTVLVSVTTTFTLTAMDSAGNVMATATVNVGPKPANPIVVTGAVVDANGQPTPGLTVVIASSSGSQTLVTDANGTFTTTNVLPPYDATVVQATQATVYQGLSRTDPTLTAFFSLTNNRSAGISGSLVGGTYPESAGYNTFLVFASPQTVHSVGTPTTATYSSTLAWPGPSTTTGTLYALQVHSSGGLPTDYPGYGTLSGVALTDTGSVTGQNVTLGSVTTGTVSGSVTAPTGYSIFYKSVAIQEASNFNLSVLLDENSSSTFSYVTPVIANMTLTVTATAVSAAGEFSAVLKADQSPNATGLTFDIPPAPTLTSPANAATGVTVSTPFNWTDFPSGVYEFQATSSSGVTFYVLTAATTATIPDLSAFGLPLPASTAFTWFVLGFAPVQTIDLLASPGGINSVTIDLSEAVSATGSFTTGP
jgi:hypothetical protein